MYTLLMHKKVDLETVVSLLLHDGVHQLVQGSLRVVVGVETYVSFTPISCNEDGEWGADKGTFYVGLEHVYGFHAIPAALAS